MGSPRGQSSGLWCASTQASVEVSLQMRSRSVQRERVVEGAADCGHRAQAAHAAAILESVLVDLLQLVGHRSFRDRSVTVTEFHDGWQGPRRPRRDAHELGQLEP